MIVKTAIAFAGGQPYPDGEVVRFGSFLFMGVQCRKLQSYDLPGSGCDT